MSVPRSGFPCLVELASSPFRQPQQGARPGPTGSAGFSRGLPRSADGVRRAVVRKTGLIVLGPLAALLWICLRVPGVHAGPATEAPSHCEVAPASSLPVALDPPLARETGR